MKYLALVLNLPYTIVGLISALMFQPQAFAFNKQNLAFIFKIKNFNISFGETLKKSRARTVGNVVMLGPNFLANDLQHELVHIQQNTKYPLIYPVLYYWEYFKHGYRNNKFEKEAFLKSS